jgi:hypothetical protein
MILWMAYAVLVGTLVGLAVRLAEPVVRSAGGPGRHLWAGALLISVALPAVALVRPPPTTVMVDAAPPALSATPDLMDQLRNVTLARPAVMERAEPWVLAGWLLASGLLALALTGGLLRLGHQARRWPRTRVAGGDALLSDGFGPALLGVFSPEVVLPPWALALDAERLHMVWVHEDEHRTAGDARLLLAAAAAVVVAPWNPSLWWQLRRLRAAVEVDCDARVLRRGVPPAAYGAMLLELGTRSPELRLPVAALSKSPSLLERRLTMIVKGAKRGGPVATTLALGTAVLLFALACEAPAPTAIQPTGDDYEAQAAATEVSEAAQDAQEIAGGLIREAGSPLVYVDEVRVEGMPKNLDPDRIDRIEVVKGEAARYKFGPEAVDGVIQIFTKEGSLERVEEGEGVATGAGGKFRLRELKSEQFDAQQLEAREMLIREKKGNEVARAEGVLLRAEEGQPKPEIVIDGTVFKEFPADLKKADIERIEVLKGKEGKKDRIIVTLKKTKSGGGSGVR